MTELAVGNAGKGFGEPAGNMRNQKSTVVVRVLAGRKLSRHLLLWLGILLQTFGLAEANILRAFYADVDFCWSPL
ncbi:hypothetical protein [Paracoccus hibiscisoli]|uniref:Uncharacterized protein n=1 Tax=Paracoccus hibiscisoli TaxID=2023261 RepID=A0A4U0QJX2_9RHOB|nr:hypothetical protein [Paracoccus hibiscisoli]TJZ82025.1 hypothetical protein FA740_15820 [Paracoccus hibiscisoli]